MGVPLRLLLIEDYEEFAHSLVLKLKNNGYDVAHERVDTSAALHSALDNATWDLVLSDYQLPNFNAIDALTIFKKKEIDIPFIVVTGTVGEETAVEVMKAGAHDYVFKGNLTRLIPVLKRELREAAMRSKLRESEGQLRQAPKLEAVGRLAGGISHDFNNVLAVILMYCDKLLDQLSPNDPNFHDVEQIKKSGERAAALTKQLLAFSRKQRLEPQVLSLNPIIQSIEKMLKVLLAENITLELKLDKNLKNVLVDPGSMEQILINLTANARDAMPNGGHYTIETANVELNEKSSEYPIAIPGTYVMMVVQDTGFGMDLKTQKKIFDPFFSTKGPKGTGLGLSTVYGIVKQSLGYIFVYSEPDRGATFRIFLPPSEAKATVVIPKAKDSGGLTAQSGTILLLEDEEDLRTIIGDALERKGYKVLKATSCEEALSIIDRRAKEIVLLVTDVQMPHLSGPEMATRMILKNPKTKILFISGYLADTLDQYEVLKSQSHFLPKPFSTETLLVQVGKILDG